MTNGQNETVNENIEEVVGTQNEITNKVIICIEGEDYIKDYEELEITFDTSEEIILNTVRPIIQEHFNVDIKDDDNWLYKTKKAIESQNIYIMPNSTAG